MPCRLDPRRQRFRRIALFSITALAAIVAAAGAAQNAEAQKTMPHACALLPRAEAEAVIGEPIGEPKKGPEAPASADVTTSQCMYASVDGQRSMSVSFDFIEPALPMRQDRRASAEHWRDETRLHIVIRLHTFASSKNRYVLTGRP